MKLEQYEYLVSDSYLEYEFVSDGPKNKIRKIVSYSPYNSNGITYFNLALGDWNEETGTIDDLAVSDNKDTLKILATIAAIVLKFTEHFPDMPVYVSGSTPSRTRLYQMSISAYWEEIEPIIFVYGYKDEKWELFRKNVNYDAFLAKRK